MQEWPPHEIKKRNVFSRILTFTKTHISRIWNLKLNFIWISFSSNIFFFAIWRYTIDDMSKWNKIEEIKKRLIPIFLFYVLDAIIVVKYNDIIYFCNTVSGLKIIPITLCRITLTKKYFELYSIKGNVLNMKHVIITTFLYTPFV